MTATGWTGPLHSVYGTHLANITEIAPGHPAALAEVRRDVRRDWLREERKQRNEQFYENLRDQYKVSIDPQAINPTTDQTTAQEPATQEVTDAVVQRF